MTGFARRTMVLAWICNEKYGSYGEMVSARPPFIKCRGKPDRTPMDLCGKFDFSRSGLWDDGVAPAYINIRGHL